MVDHPHPIIIKTIQTLGSKLQDLLNITEIEISILFRGQIQSLPEKSTANFQSERKIMLISFSTT
jgi:hypothetical protein